MITETVFKNCCSRFLAFALAVGVAANAHASDFGTVGNITLPSARMTTDGDLSATVSTNQVASIYNVSYQVTPFLESTFRYTVFNPYGRDFSRDVLRDRSLEAKLRLLKETKNRPQLAIGVRDILGTGAWGSEYLVASKRVGRLDLSGGVGWGRFAEANKVKNPLSYISSEFENRPTGTRGLGGKSRANTFFRGPMGFFWGASYAIPNMPLTVLIEQSSDLYLREEFLKSFASQSRASLGLRWQVSDELELTTSWQKGAFASLSVKSTIGTKKPPKRTYERVKSSLDKLGQLEAPEFLDMSAWYDRFLYDAERTGLKIYEAELSPGSSSLKITFANLDYPVTINAIDQAMTLVNLHAPKSVLSADLSLKEDDFNAATFRYFRRGIEATNATVSSERKVPQAWSVLPFKQLANPTNRTDFGLPSITLGADLAMRFQLMDPDEPLKHQLYLKGTGQFEITQATSVWFTSSIDLTNNFNTRRPSDSVLPKVRSELNKYLTEGETGIDNFYIENRRNIRRETHVRLYAGILEDMFGGAGAELLFEPFGKRWAFGGNVNWVRQRGFDKRFDFQNYSTMTGHISALYASPFYNFDFGLHVGSYLAGDRGYTVEARRTFNHGFSIGAFFTRTNVSTEDFGEGSFDKGFYIRVPFAMLLGGNTRGSYKTILRPIERDGGRRLEGFAGELWWDRRAVRFDSLQPKQRK